jgi:hypothetical protein
VIYTTTFLALTGFDLDTIHKIFIKQIICIFVIGESMKKHNYKPFAGWRHLLLTLTILFIVSYLRWRHLLLTLTILFIVSYLRFCNCSFQFSYYISTVLELSNRFLLIGAPTNIVYPFGYRPFIDNIRRDLRFVKFPEKNS